MTCPHCNDQGWTVTVSELMKESGRTIEEHGYSLGTACCPESMHGEARWAGMVILLAHQLAELRTKLEAIKYAVGLREAGEAIEVREQPGDTEPGAN